jgi:hypothetical protein
MPVDLRRALLRLGLAAVAHAPAPVGNALVTTWVKRNAMLLGLDPTSVKARDSRTGFTSAHPEADAEAFVLARYDVGVAQLAFVTRALVRMAAGKPPPTRVRDHGVDWSRPTVVLYLHTVWDPLVPYALVRERPGTRWVVFPIAGENDSRRSWTIVRPSPEVMASLLSVLDPSWGITAVRHLRKGGHLLLAADAAFDGRTKRSRSIAIGEATYPLAGGVDVLVQGGRAQLAVLTATRHGPELAIEVAPAASIEAATDALGGWIGDNELTWAGWPGFSGRITTARLRQGSLGII